MSGEFAGDAYWDGEVGEAPSLTEVDWHEVVAKMNALYTPEQRQRMADYQRRAAFCGACCHCIDECRWDEYKGRRR